MTRGTRRRFSFLLCEHETCCRADASGILFRVTEFASARLRLAAIQLGFKPVLQQGRERWPGTLEGSKLLDVGPKDSAQLLLDRRKVDAGAAAVADDQPSVHNHLAQQRGVTSREQQFDRIDGHDPIAIEAIEI